MQQCTRVLTDKVSGEWDEKFLFDIQGVQLTDELVCTVLHSRSFLGLGEAQDRVVGEVRMNLPDIAKGDGLGRCCTYRLRAAADPSSAGDDHAKQEAADGDVTGEVELRFRFLNQSEFAYATYEAERLRAVPATSDSPLAKVGPTARKTLDLAAQSEVTSELWRNALQQEVCVQIAMEAVATELRKLMDVFQDIAVSATCSAPHVGLVLSEICALNVDGAFDGGHNATSSNLFVDPSLKLLKEHTYAREEWLERYMDALQREEADLAKATAPGSAEALHKANAARRKRRLAEMQRHEAEHVAEMTTHYTNHLEARAVQFASMSKAITSRIDTWGSMLVDPSIITPDEELARKASPADSQRTRFVASAEKLKDRVFGRLGGWFGSHSHAGRKRSASAEADVKPVLRKWPSSSDVRPGRNRKTSRVRSSSRLGAGEAEKAGGLAGHDAAGAGVGEHPVDSGDKENRSDDEEDAGGTPPPPRHRVSAGGFATALYDNNAESPFEVSAKEGDRLVCLARVGEWWRVRVERTNDEGLIPANRIAGHRRSSIPYL